MWKIYAERPHVLLGEKKKKKKTDPFPFFPSLFSFYTHRAPFSSNVFVDGRNVSCRPREIYDETESSRENTPRNATFPFVYVLRRPLFP